MRDLDIRIVEEKEDIVVVQLIGSLDFSNASQLRDVASVLYEKGCRRMILSCESLHYINSAGLRVLLEIARKLNTQTCAVGLSLCAVSRYVREVLNLSGLLRCVLLCDDVAQARQALNKENC